MNVWGWAWFSGQLSAIMFNKAAGKRAMDEFQLLSQGRKRGLAATVGKAEKPHRGWKLSTIFNNRAAP